MRFLLQLYAARESDGPRAFHRSLYLFISPRGAELTARGAVCALRCQLPRENPFYPGEPPEEGDAPRQLLPGDDRIARLRSPIWAAAQDRADAAFDNAATAQSIADTARAEARAAQRAADEAGRSGARFDIGIMPGWAYIGDPPDGLPPAWLTGSPDHIAEELRADRAAGANVFHLKFRGRTIEEYLDQLAAFGEQVRPQL